MATRRLYSPIYRKEYGKYRRGLYAPGDAVFSPARCSVGTGDSGVEPLLPPRAHRSSKGRSRSPLAPIHAGARRPSYRSCRHRRARTARRRSRRSGGRLQRTGPGWRLAQPLDLKGSVGGVVVPSRRGGSPPPNQAISSPLFLIDNPRPFSRAAWFTHIPILVSFLSKGGFHIGYRFCWSVAKCVLR